MERMERFWQQQLEGRGASREVAARGAGMKFEGMKQEWNLEVQREKFLLSRGLCREAEIGQNRLEVFKKGDKKTSEEPVVKICTKAKTLERREEICKCL